MMDWCTFYGLKKSRPPFTSIIKLGRARIFLNVTPIGRWIVRYTVHRKSYSFLRELSLSVTSCLHPQAAVCVQWDLYFHFLNPVARSLFLHCFKRFNPSLSVPIKAALNKWFYCHICLVERHTGQTKHSTLFPLEGCTGPKRCSTALTAGLQ